MLDRILKGGSYFFSLFFVASFVIMQSGGCEFPNSQTPELTKEVVTITAPSIEEKTEEKIKDDKETTTTEGTTTGLSDETSSDIECVSK
jgi:hypothetical protein